MNRGFKVAAVSGSVQRLPRALALVGQLLTTLAEMLPIDVHLITPEKLASAIGDTSYRDQLPGRVQAELATIESADVFAVGNPVYRGSYTGLFKHLLDFVHHEALIDVPVLLTMMDGSDRHAPVIDHQLHPLSNPLQAHTLPLGICASEQDFNGHEITSQALYEQIILAVARALPLLSASSADNLRTVPIAQVA